MATRQVNINTNIIGADQVERLKRQLVDTNKLGKEAAGSLGQIGEALASKTVPEMTAYADLWRKSSEAAKAFQSIARNAVESVAATVKRQQDLSKFYGTSIFTTSMINLNSASRNFVSQGGKGFNTWLQTSLGQLSQYRGALAAAGAAFVAFSAAAALNSKQSVYAIDSLMDSMESRFSDPDAMRKWFSEGTVTTRSERTNIMSTLLSQPNYMISGEQAKMQAEAVEKVWFANQEQMKRNGIASAEALAQAVASGSLSQEQNLALFGNRYGLGMAKAAAPGRFAMLGDIASGINMDEEMEKRPELMLRTNLKKITDTTGDMMIGPMNKVLNLILKIGEAIDKIPGANKFVGWGLMFGTAATGGLLFVSVLGGMIPMLTNVIRLLHLHTLASKGYAVATNLATAASKLFKVALMSTGVGALLVLAGTLVAIAYKTGALQKAWDKFKGSAIGKDFAAGLEHAVALAGNLFGWIDKMFDKLDKSYASGGAGKMMLTMALGPIAAPFLLIGKILPDMSNRIKKLVEGSDALQKLARFSNTVIKRIMEFIEKMVGLFSAAKDLIQNVLDALPGAEKRKAETALAEKAAKYGLEYKNGEFWGMTGGTTAGNVTEDYVKKNYNEVWEAFTSGDKSKFKSLMDQVGLTYNAENPGGWYQLGGGGGTYGVIGGKDVGQGQVPADLWADYLAKEAMPDFLGDLLGGIEMMIPGAEKEAARKEWVAAIESAGLTGYYGVTDKGQRYTDANGNLVGETDELKALRERYEKLPGFADDIASAVTSALDRWTPDWDFPDLTIPGFDDMKASIDSLVETIKNWSPVKGASEAFGNAEDAINTYLPEGSTERAAAEAAGTVLIPGLGTYKMVKGVWELAGLDVGGPILSSGPLIGHAGEEIVPANVKRGGTTTLARINEIMEGGVNVSGGGNVYHISAPVSIPNATISNDMDLALVTRRVQDGLIFSLRNELDHLQTRGIGSLRGGSIK